VWNLETGQELLTLKGHSSWVRAVALSPDGTKVISASADKTIKVWNLDTQEELLTLKGHSGAVEAVALNPDGTKVISGSRDSTLKVWNLDAGEVIASFTGDGALTRCAFAPDGVTIVAGDALGRMHFLRLEGMEASS
jgi:WD40 repeat protein